MIGYIRRKIEARVIQNTTQEIGQYIHKSLCKELDINTDGKVTRNELVLIAENLTRKQFRTTLLCLPLFPLVAGCTYVMQKSLPPVSVYATALFSVAFLCCFIQESYNTLSNYIIFQNEARKNLALLDSHPMQTIQHERVSPTELVHGLIGHLLHQNRNHVRLVSRNDNPKQSNKQSPKLTLVSN